MRYRAASWTLAGLTALVFATALTLLGLDARYIDAGKLAFEAVLAVAIMLYAGLFFWTLGYDTIYAHQDKEDDALIGVKSTALLFGARSRDWILGFYAVGFALVLASGFTAHAGWPFAFLMLLAGGHLLWQVHRLNVEDPEACLKIFRSNRDTGALIALAFIVSSWVG